MNKPITKTEPGTTSPPVFKADHNGVLNSPDSDLVHNQKMLETTGSKDRGFQNQILNEAASSNPFFFDNPEKALNRTAAALHGINPKDTIEGMLASQMVAIHNLTMRFTTIASDSEQPTRAREELTRLVIKLSRTYSLQCEALNKHRKSGSHQMVTVEHVHVHQGGQAIVGNISPQSKG
ncbi:MAG: hypothetical protein HON90_09785 [Halobacteriovoraceae bacterium]|jgi:hypothetical protein|nr:hypothetical protein [Halobacteriovoraceae bacterium]